MTRKWETPPATSSAKPLLGRILEARGLNDHESLRAFLDPKLSTLEDPSELPGATEAGEILCKAIRAGEKVLIYGDYDADGITASAVLYHIIAAATGKEGPAVYIPNRIEEGYGINVGAIEKFAQEGVDVIVSVDCGVTAVEAAKKAKQLGITLIVTDHHKPREDGELPDCAAIVHPGLEGEPETFFAGVGVAYQLGWAFARAWSGAQHVTDTLSKCLLEMLPFVAIGTIADMVPLQNGNRILSRWGLQLLPSTTNPGLCAIMKQLDTPKMKLNTAHVSFGIAPLINAVGRLSHAGKAVDLLTHLDGALAESTAEELAKLNRDRQKVQREIIADAMEIIKEQQLQEKSIIVLQNDDWNRGVVGVAAGKCIETHYRPTILLSGDGDELVGSARSISGFSIYDAISACKEHVVKFGGHDMAAGLCVARDKFDDFVAAITEYANEHISPDQLVKTVRPDAFAELDEITQGSAVDIEKVGPFGIGNPTPIVQINNVTIDQVSVMGSKGAHLTMQLGQSNKRIRAIWWSMGDAAKQLQRGVQIDIVAKIKVNEFRGTRTAELDIIDIALPSG